jgi:hypothetical protein
MKKVLVSIVALAMVAGFTSCKKEVACECDLGILGKVKSACVKLNSADRKTYKQNCETSSLCKQVDC